MPRNTRIAVEQGGHYFQIAGNYNHHVHSHSTSNDDTAVRKREALKKLFENIAPSAFHNSADRHDPPKCHPRTREAILRKILDWAKDPHNLRLLMWIYGPAGAGKSAIMQTMAELLEELGILGGSFFFLRGAAKRDEKTHLVTTLAYQLTLSVPNFEHYIAEIIDRDPSIFSRTLAVQMKALVIDPMTAAARDNPRSNEWCYVMLVDGLDECSPEKSHREIITLLSDSAAFPFRFIVASRPEFAIRDTFSVQAVMEQVQSLILDDTYQPDDDIRLFLMDKFEDIKARHPARRSIPNIWPGTSVNDTLVQNASSQFIYAATVIKFIESPHHNPMTHLDRILKTGPTIGKSDMPFAQVDALYHHILASVADLNKVLSILHCLMYINPTDLPLVNLEDIYGYPAGEINIILCDMHSLLHIPDTSDNKNIFGNKDTSDDKIAGQIKFHHASLSDFLSDPFRAKHLYVPPSNAKASIAISLINQYKAFIRRNELFSFVLVFPQILKESCITAELVEALSAFNPYKGFDMSLFTWENILATYDNPDHNDIDCTLHALEVYHSWVDDKRVHTFSTLAANLHIAAVENLDTWLSKGLPHARGESGFNTFIISSFIQIHMTGVDIHKYFAIYHQHYFYEERFAGSTGLVSDIRQVTSNPLRATYQTMQTLNICPEIALLEYYLNLRREHYLIIHKKVEHGEFVYWMEFSYWVNSLLTLIAATNARPECGNALKMYQSQPHDDRGFAGKVPITIPYVLEECNLEEHKLECTEDLCLNRKYLSILLLKEDLKRLAHAAMDCFKKTNTEIEPHDYNRNHFVCFLCQSTDEFVRDGEFGMDFNFNFDPPLYW